MEHIAVIRCPLCGARQLRFVGDRGQCTACGFVGPASEVVRHVETELERLRTRLERIVHEKQDNTEYLVRELADSRRAVNLNTFFIVGIVVATAVIGWLTYPWQHSEYIYLALVCIGLIFPVAVRRRWLRRVLKDKEQDVGGRIRDVAEDLDRKAKFLAEEVEETEEFLGNITGGT